MTEEQAELAARKLCELIGDDPDQLVVSPNTPGPDGVTVMVLRRTQRWKVVATMLRKHHAMNEAIRFGIENSKTTAAPTAASETSE